MYLLPNKERLIEFLEACELFKGVKRSALKSLVTNLEPVYLEGQKTLIREGDLDNDLFLVIHGRLRVFKNADTEEEEILAEIGAGQVVGEIAILVDMPRTATVKAIRDTVLVKLNKKNYEEFVDAHPQSGINIAKSCIERLLTMQKKGKVSKNVNTVTFIPLADSKMVNHLMRDLVRELEKMSTVFLVTRGTAEALVGDIHDILNKPEQFEMLLRFLNEQEYAYRYVLYQADETYTPWTELCARQADAIYIIKDAQSEEKVENEIEEHILKQKSVSSRISLILRHKAQGDHFGLAYDWIRRHKISDYYHIEAGNKGDINRIIRLITGNSTGLVLSGGGARGLAHIGVIRALEQKNIPIDIIGGTSAGSLIAGAYAMGLGSHEIERICNEFLKAGSSFDLTFPYISLTSGYKLVQVLKKVFGDKLIEELPTRMFCVSSNITKNEVCIHDTGPLWKAIRASISLPGIYPPVFSQGNLLVDGAVLNNLPVEIMNKKFNAGKVIASLVLMSSDKYKSSIEADILSGWKILLDKLNPFSVKTYIPRIDTILARSMNLNELNHQMMQAQQSDFSFLLNLGQFGLMDFKQYPEIIETGYRQAMQKLESLDFNTL
jgi:predicted acylesterase/phospholipase RssA/CRP-like cAMP-binding protein